MNIDLTREEITKILKEKYGDGFFRVLYTESDKSYESRNKIDIKSMDTPPKKESYVLYFDDL